MSLRPTIATIVGNVIMFWIFFSFILTLFINFINLLDVNLPPRPEDPLLVKIYDATYLFYNYLKKILTNPIAITVLFVIDIILLAFYVKWRNYYTQYWQT